MAGDARLGTPLCSLGRPAEPAARVRGPVSTKTKEMHASRSANLAQPRRQRLADDRGDAGRPDERARTRRALRRRDAEALVDQQHDARRSPRSPSCSSSGCCGRSRWASARRSTASRTTGFFGNFIGKPGPVLGHTEPTGPGATSRCIGSRGVPELAALRLLPVRVRRDHADPDARARCSGGSTSRPGSRSSPCGSRSSTRVDAFLIWGGGFFAHHGARRLLGRLRDPPVGRRVGLRRGGGDRAAAATRPRDRRAQQRRDGRGRRRAAVAGLERLQRRRPVLREHVGLRRDPEHEPVHRGRVPGLGRLGLPDRPQAGPDRRASTG